MIDKPPCKLNSVDECTYKTALECLAVMKSTNLNKDELSQILDTSQPLVEGKIKEGREQLKKCLIERFLSGQFGAPGGTANKGPLR